MSPLDVLPWVAATFGLISFVGAVTVFIKGSADKGTIQTQRDSIEALLERDRIKDQQIADLKASDASKTARIEVLENLANSGDKIDAMRVAVLASIHDVYTDLGTHNQTAMDRIDGVLGALNSLPKGIAAELAAEIVKAMKGTT